MRGWVTIATSVVLVIAISAITAKSVVIRSVENGQDARLDDLEQRGVGAGQRLDRDRQRGGDRDQDVDDAGDDHAADEGAREGLVRVDGLLGHVGGVLEAGHGEEGERDAGDDRQDRAALER